MSFLPLPTNLFPYWMFPWNTDTWDLFTRFIYHKELLAIDAIRQLFVWKVFSFDLIKQMILPFWNPYNFSGQPFLANFQSSIFYPISWLFILLPQISAWSIYIFLQPILAALFMYIFLRNKFGSKLVSFFGAISLIFSSYFATRYFWGVYIHSLLWVPLGLFLIDRYIEDKLTRRQFIGLEAIVLAMSILGGYPQHGVFVLILSFAYFVFKMGFLKTWVYGLAVVMSVLICAIQIVPTIELYQNSLRETVTSKEVFDRSILDFKYLVTIFSPDFFGSPGNNNYFGDKDYSGANAYFGIVPLVFAIFALQDLKKNREARFWISIAILSLFFSFQTSIANLPAILHIPIASSGGAWNNLFFFQFSGVMLAVVGLSNFINQNNLSLRKILIFISVFYLGILFLGRNSIISIRNTMFVAVVVPILFFGNIFLSKKLVLLSIFLTAVVGILYLFKMSPFGDMKYFYPTHPLISFLKKEGGINRFWGPESAKIPSNLATYFKIYSPEGYDSLVPGWYGELLQTTKTGEIPIKLNRADIVVSDADTVFRRRLLNLLGVKYFLDKSDQIGGDNGPNFAKFSVDRFELIKQWGTVSVYQNKESYPRAYLADSFQVLPHNKIIEAIYSEKNDLRKTIFLEKDPGVGNLATGFASVIRYGSNEVEIETQSDRSSLLFLSDSFFPGWKVRVNREYREVLRADYAFRAVLVPAGINRVEFSYEPESFKNGVFLSGIGLVLSLWLIFSKKLLRIPGFG